MTKSKSLPLPCSTGVHVCHELGQYSLTQNGRGWINRRLTSDGQEFTLSGVGTAPSDSQLELWKNVDRNLNHYLRVAIEAVPLPPKGDWDTDGFSRNELLLEDVELLTDNSFAFGFNSPYCDEIGLWPDVVFKDNTVRKTEWLV